MKAFASWSGGKDCMLALYRFLKEPKNELISLLNMCDDDGEKSRSHGLQSEIIALQAERMGLKIIQQKSNFNEYEKNFKKAVNELKKDGVNTGIFGDIYLKEHRIWIERVCNDLQITPVFPLWENNTTDLLKEFISEGFKTIVVAANTKQLGNEWVGRLIDNDFLKDILKLKNVDPCAENGEYHSFVYDGPLFKTPVLFETGEKYIDEETCFLEIR